MKTLIAVIVMAFLLNMSMTALSHEKEHAKPKAATENNKPDARYAWKVNWLTLDEGVKKSREKKKPMIVDFATHEGCPRCEFLQENVYSKDIIVAKINDDFIPIFIDLGEDLTPDEQALGDKHEFHDDCMLLFLNHKKEPIFDEQGGKMCFIDEIQPKAFIRYLDHVINVNTQQSSN